MFRQTHIYVLIIILRLFFEKNKASYGKDTFFFSGVETFSAALNN